MSTLLSIEDIDYKQYVVKANAEDVTNFVDLFRVQQNKMIYIMLHTAMTDKQAGEMLMKSFAETADFLEMEIKIDAEK
jgi:hypothetical protein